MFPERQSGLTVVATYWYPVEANVAKGLLESEGIESWVLDEHQIRMQWHHAGALGGVKLGVAPDDAARARALLAEDRSDFVRGVPEQSLPPAFEEICPVCGGQDTRLTRSHVMARPLQWLPAAALSWLVGVLIARRRSRVQGECHACGHRWRAA